LTDKKVGILSDTHNDTVATHRALQEFRRLGIDTVFHCGDVTTAEMVPLFEEFTAYFVRGNMDRNAAKALKKAMGVHAGAHWLGKGREIELHGRRIAVTHGDRPDLYETLLSSEPDYLFKGHTHRRQDDRMGCTRIINPGALGGVKYETRSVAVLDLASDELHVIEL
jgi:putative phosphoesterase